MKKFLLSFVLFCGLSVPFLSQTQAMSIACTMEAKLCSDGVTYVGRTGPNCEFAACPSTSSPSPGVSSPGFPGVGGYACTEEAKTCSDGTTVWRVGPNCEFMACPNDGDTPISDDPVMCTMDAKVCSDGSSVGRTGPNCEFAKCPDEINYLKVVSKDGLKVNFQSLIGDFSQTRPSYVDGRDTVIDFGDDSQYEWLHCSKSDTNNNICSTPIKVSHTYAKSGTYEVKILKTGGHCRGECPITTVSSLNVTVKEGVGGACPELYLPVCGQPKQSNPFAGIVAPKTYSNKCVMESEGATLLNQGKCIGDFGPKVQQTLDDKVDQLIEKIEAKISNVAQKKNVVDKMLLKLEAKVKTFTHLEGIIKYIQSKLEEYSMGLE